MMLPHQPFVARKEDYDEYVGKVPMPRTREPYSDKLHPYFQWWRKRTGIEEVTDDEIMRCRIAYWALVTRTDALIGEMLEALRSNGFEDNTMVVYSTDHGEQVGEHDLWWKQTFYEDSARVPAIVSWPGVLPEGGRCDRVINQFDLNATMLDAVGAPPLPRSNGRSSDRSAQGARRHAVGGRRLLGVRHVRPAGRPPVRHTLYARRLGAEDGALQRVEAQLLPRHETAALQPGGRPGRDERPWPRTRPTARSGTSLSSASLDGWDPDEVTRKMSLAQQRRAGHDENGPRTSIHPIPTGGTSDLRWTTLTAPSCLPLLRPRSRAHHGGTERGDGLPRPAR